MTFIVSVTFLWNMTVINYHYNTVTNYAMNPQKLPMLLSKDCPMSIYSPEPHLEDRRFAFKSAKKKVNINSGCMISVLYSFCNQWIKDQRSLTWLMSTS